MVTPDSFKQWLFEMKSVYKSVNSDADCARLLGISANAVVEMKKRGADRRTGLACRALLQNMEPYC